MSLHEGLILDGRNRFRACLLAGVEPHFEPNTGKNPLGFAVALNLSRGHLSESQRAMVAAKLETIPHGGDRKSDQDANLHLDRQQAATTLNVSPRTVASAKKVADEAAPELLQAEERGTVSVSAAADVATLPKQQQVEIDVRGEREILEAAKAIGAERADKSRTERVEKIAEIAKANQEYKQR